MICTVSHCDRSVVEICRRRENFTLVKVLGFNPRLLAPIHFLAELEKPMCIAVDDASIKECMDDNHCINTVKRIFSCNYRKT